jgi:hypothetical protein
MERPSSVHDVHDALQRIGTEECNTPHNTIITITQHSKTTLVRLIV